MRISSFLLGALGASQAAAQAPEIPPVRYPSLPPAAADAAGFVPAGWAILASKRGDLNGDGAADLVLLLQMRDAANILAVPSGNETEPFDTNPHMLAVAFAEPGGGYRLAASNRGLFPRPAAPWNGDEPPGEDSIRLERGGLLVYLGYLRGWASYRFRWQSGAMRLIGYDHGGASGGCVETMSINYLTGRARWETGLISSDRGRVVWRGLRRADRPTLDRIDLETFQPEESIAGPPLLCPEPRDG